MHQCNDLESYLTWNEDEIEENHVSQIGVSACGATAALTVLNFFKFPVETEAVVKAVNTRLRNTTAPLPEYLKSRSVAGTTHQDIINGIHSLSNGKVCCRFFAFYPKRQIDLHQWILSWLRKGAILIATLNLQREKPPVNGRLADAWHHQVIYGVSATGVHLFNPISLMTVEEIGHILCSDSVLKIRLEDVLLRYNPEMDLSGLLDTDDKRWELMAVDDQINKLYNKACQLTFTQTDKSDLLKMIRTEYLTIPAAYESGITVCISNDSEYCCHLYGANELPSES